MIWSFGGFIGALVLAVVAWRRSLAPGGFYDREVYAMDARTHRRYAAIGLSFAAYFAVTSALRLATAGIVGLALYALIAVFYLTSFAQGAADRDE